MRKTIILCLILIALNPTVVNGVEDNKIFINSVEMSSSDVVEKSGMSYYPMRKLVEGLGGSYSWDTKTKSINGIAQDNIKVNTKELDKFFNVYGDTISVYYENIETGYAYSYNSDKIYFSASIIKAPYSLFVYQSVERDKADLLKIHTYKSSDYRSGTGIIKNMKVGSKFTESDLLKYAIRNSDNIAFRMLINKYGKDTYKEFVSTIGGVANNIGTVTGANMSARETGLYARNIYTYIEGDNKYSQKFKTDLMSTTNPMIKADYPIARKYGWANKSFHDMAIVYAPSPYILVIMSARDNGNSSDYKAFSDISIKIQEFNNIVSSKDDSTSEPIQVVANPNATKVIVDGKTIEFEAYTIKGYNYFKLRDLSTALCETDKCFSVEWLNDAGMIELKSFSRYIPKEGDLKKGDGTIKKATLTDSLIYKDNVIIDLKGYLIGSNNYFKLRDIGIYFDFAVDWDAKNNTIVIDTSRSYGELKQVEQIPTVPTETPIESEYTSNSKIKAEYEEKLALSLLENSTFSVDTDGALRFMAETPELPSELLSYYFQVEVRVDGETGVHVGEPMYYGDLKIEAGDPLYGSVTMTDLKTSKQKIDWKFKVTGSSIDYVKHEKLTSAEVTVSLVKSHKDMETLYKVSSKYPTTVYKITMTGSTNEIQKNLTSLFNNIIK